MHFHIIVEDNRTMDMTIDQQVALDETLAPHASRLRIGKSNFCLRSDITSKESTLQVATAIVHHHSNRFKMNNKKRIVNLEYFREMLHICLRIPNQTFDELSFKEEILAFLRYFGHSGEIKKITDDPLIPRRNKVNWHYVRDDKMFMTIKLVSRHQNTQQFGVMLPVELTNEDIRNSVAYKEYYVIALGASPPKTKASVPDVPTYESDEEISWKSSDEDDDNDVDDQSDDANDDDDQEDKDEQDDNDDDQDSDNNDEGPDVEDDDEELYRDVNINLEGRDVQMTDVHTTQVLEDTHVTLTPVNLDGQQQSSQSSSVSSQFVTSMFNPSHDVGIDSLFESTPWVDVPVMTTVVPLLVTVPTLPPPSIPIMSQVQQAPAPTPTTAPSTSLQDPLNLALCSGLTLEAKVLTRASNSSNTSYVVAADLSELELKRILIEKMESNMSIYRSDEQQNLYKALVDAYECDKIILDTYRDTVTFKRRHDDEDKDEEPSAGSDRGSKRNEQTASESTPAEEPIQTTQDLEEPKHQEFETGAADDQPVAEASQHPEWF
nr:hypothetical protein [Tanacetum cinerariifolium]